jgi:hypothetical protein
MIFTLTTAGESLISSFPGIPPVFDEFRLGTGFGYIPSITDTAMHGAPVHTGVPSAGIIQANTLVKYTIAVEPNIGPFLFGEVGLYVGGALMALGCASSLVTKTATVGAIDGNMVAIDCYLTTSGTSYTVYAELGNSAAQGIIPHASSIEALPPAQNSLANLYLVASPDTQNSVIAFSLAGQWNVTGYEELVHSRVVASGSASTVTLTASSIPPNYNGELILQFLDGPNAGTLRIADSYVSGSKTFTFSTALPGTPQAGNLVQVLRKSVLSPVVRNIFSGVSVSLTSAHLNALIANPVDSALFRVDGTRAMTGTADFGGFVAHNVGNPVSPGDAANKDYVDTELANYDPVVLQVASGAPTGATPTSPAFYLRSDVSPKVLYVYDGAVWTSLDPAVLSTVLTGLALNPGPVLATDTILSAIGKTQYQINALDLAFNTFVARTDNPHSVTKAQVGLGDADDTSDANKPISTATAAALLLKEPVVAAGLPSDYWRGDKVFAALDKAAVGLWNVDNTSDVNKPVSTATATALSGKENSLAAGGTVLDFLRGDKTWANLPNNVRGTELTGIDTVSVASITAVDTVLSGLGKLQAQASAAVTALAGKEPAITAGLTTQFYRGDKTWVVPTKADVGLGNVDDTSDANKPISTATAAALLLKEPVVTAATSAEWYRGDKVFTAITKTDVGLANVDNTSDMSKPISTAGVLALANKEPLITAGLGTQYLTGTKAWADFNASVRIATLTGLTTALGPVVLPTDTVLHAIGSLQNQVTNRLDKVSPSYTGGLTGDNGVVNIGAGQIYKDTLGNLGFGTTAPMSEMHVRRTVAGSMSMVMTNDSPANPVTLAEYAFSADGTNLDGYFRSKIDGSGRVEVGYTNNFGIKRDINGTPTDAVTLDGSGKMLVYGTGLGFGAGAGSTATQTVSKSGTVTLNKATGRIFTHNETMLADTTAIFVCNNSLVTNTTVVSVSHSGGGNASAYIVWARAEAGLIRFHIWNRTALPLSEALELTFVCHEGSIS